MRKIIVPSRLDGGLFNQIEALLGYALTAQDHNAALVLPNLSSHVVHGRTVPFATVFEADAFTTALAERELLVLDAGRGDPAAELVRPRAFVGRLRFEKFSRQQQRLIHGVATISPRDRLEASMAEAVHRGLRPVAPLRAIADEFVRSELAAACDAPLAMCELAPQRARFGCVHGRIERDMQIYWRSVGAGPPPTLCQTMDQMATIAALRQAPRIFIAVGKNIFPQRADARLLARGVAPWGARLVRRAAPRGAIRSSFVREYNATHDTPSYLANALVDFHVCRAAEWFVGWSGSSFSRAVAHFRQLDATGDRTRQDRSAGWYAVCNDSIAWRTDGGADPKLCLPAGHHAAAPAALAAIETMREAVASRRMARGMTPHSMPQPEAGAEAISGAGFGSRPTRLRATDFGSLLPGGTTDVHAAARSGDIVAGNTSAGNIFAVGRGRRQLVLLETLRSLEEASPTARFHRLAQANLRRWKAAAPAAAKTGGCVVRVLRGDWGEVTHQMTKQHGTTFASLNMANAHAPGGGYTHGAIAQEENMFRRTDCHFSLVREDTPGARDGPADMGRRAGGASFADLVDMLHLHERRGGAIADGSGCLQRESSPQSPGLARVAC
jgi:hypothetical protein